MAPLLLPALAFAYLLAVLLLLAVGVTVLAWMLYAWWTPESSEQTGFPATPREPAHTFSLIVPARQEEAVLGVTLQKLAELDHPAYEVIVVVGHDDAGTAAVAERWARRHPDIGRVVTDWSWPKNKPKALNEALPYCRGDMVGIFDAEDEVHPQLLRYIDTTLVDSGADIVQGGIQLMNYQSSWWALRAVLEYYVHFRSRLRYHARQGFIPLGGNTVFVRTELVRATGGWDPDCLAEDCELGVRLSALGARTVVAYEPALVTKEETPTSLGGLFRQRVRWDQGFLQVLRKGEWAWMPTRRQRFSARYTLATPFLQAVSWLLVPLELSTMPFLHIPVALALVSFLLFIPFGAMFALDFVAFGEFCRRYGFTPRRRDRVRVVFGAPLYQFVLAGAAAQAVWREMRGVRTWEKTEHAGAHRAALQLRDA
jgi:cellulose synthase/poly-beta-1,6-N-acetylglucosamine synthase-like glycosyltransferase